MKFFKSICSILILIPLLNPTLISSEKKFNVKEWKNSLLKFRLAKDKEFKTSSTSPMAGYMRITLQKGDKIFLTVENGKILKNRLKPEHFNALFYEQNDSWYFSNGVEGNPSLLSGFGTLKMGKFTIKYYPLQNTLVLAIFNPDRDKIREFKHLLYYPPDTKYRVKGRLIRFKSPEKIAVPTSRKLQKEFFRYAKIRFKIDNNSLYLTVLKSSLEPEDPDSKYIFIPFADKTSGRETYDGGRFIEMEEPEGDDIILDFNYCFNPLCNYADVYNCTLPPFENELPIEIKSGEKTYPH